MYRLGTRIVAFVGLACSGSAEPYSFAAYSKNNALIESFYAEFRWEIKRPDSEPIFGNGSLRFRSPNLFRIDTEVRSRVRSRTGRLWVNDFKQQIVYRSQSWKCEQQGDVHSLPVELYLLMAGYGAEANCPWILKKRMLENHGYELSADRGEVVLPEGCRSVKITMQQRPLKIDRLQIVRSDRSIYTLTFSNSWLNLKGVTSDQFKEAPYCFWGKRWQYRTVKDNKMFDRLMHSPL